MKRWAPVVVMGAAVALAACQRQAAERTEEVAPENQAVETPAPGAESAPGPAQAQAPAAATARRPAAAPAARAPEAAAPAPASKPTPPRVLAAGTSIPVLLDTTVASNASQVEDRVLARVAEDVAEDGRVVLPEGAEVIGHVIAALPSGRVKGRARLAVRFQEVRVGGVSYALEATDLDVTAASGKGKDAKILGGAAGAGAIIGAIAGGGKGALKGAAIGGAAGGAAVLATKGDEVVFKAGERYALELTHSLQVD